MHPPSTPWVARATGVAILCPADLGPDGGHAVEGSAVSAHASIVPIMETAREPRNLWRIVIVSLLAAVLLAVIVGSLAIVSTLNAQQDQRTYEACMARQGFAFDAPAPDVRGDDELDRYISALDAAARQCGRG